MRFDAGKAGKAAPYGRLAALLLVVGWLLAGWSHAPTIDAGQATLVAKAGHAGQAIVAERPTVVAAEARGNRPTAVRASAHDHPPLAATETAAFASERGRPRDGGSHRSPPSLRPAQERVRGPPTPAGA